MSLQPSHNSAPKASLPQLERGISIAPIRHFDALRTQIARPSIKPLSQRLVYAAAIILCIFAIAQCLRATFTHLFKLEALLQASGAVHSSALEESNTNLSLRDQMALYQSPRGVEILARERLNLVGENEVLVQLFTADGKPANPIPRPE